MASSPYTPAGLQAPIVLRSKTSNSIRTTLQIQAQDSTDLTPPSTPADTPRTSIDTCNKNCTSAMASTEITPFLYELVQGQIIGHGAWSEVYLAKLANRTALPEITPPPSPTRAQGFQSSDLTLYAIKVPVNKMARKIIENEARILTDLSRGPEASEHIISFYGQIVHNFALVLDLAENDLSTIIQERKAIEDSLPTSNSPTVEPLMGLQEWLRLAHSLTTSLAWVHSQDVVHGDLKPGNILSVRGKWVIADFSSSIKCIGEGGHYTPRATDAITTEYASPELLKAYSISTPIEDKSPRHQTFESDVWALACTLLVAATGYEPYPFAGNRMRRLAMCKDGGVMSGYIADDFKTCMRVKRGGMVDKVVKSALNKITDKRIEASDWALLIKELAVEANFVL